MASSARPNIWPVSASPGGAGVVPRLPLTKLAVPALCAAYLARGVACPLLEPAVPKNSRRSWLVSLGICLVAGLVHVYGVVALRPAQ